MLKYDCQARMLGKINDIQKKGIEYVYKSAIKKNG